MLKDITAENKWFKDHPKEPQFEISKRTPDGKEVVERTDAAFQDRTGTIYWMMKDTGMDMVIGRVYRIQCAEHKIDIHFAITGPPYHLPKACTFRKRQYNDKRAHDFDFMAINGQCSLIGFRCWAPGKEPK